MRLFAICIAQVLSQNNLHEGISISKYLNNCLSHNDSEVRVANALYSDSVYDLDTVDCFLNLHAINDSPMKIQKPIVYFLVEMQLSQFASEYAEICKDEFGEKRMHCPRVPFRYCRI